MRERSWAGGRGGQEIFLYILSLLHLKKLNCVPIFLCKFKILFLCILKRVNRASLDDKPNEELRQHAKAWKSKTFMALGTMVYGLSDWTGGSLGAGRRRWR